MTEEVWISCSPRKTYEGRQARNDKVWWDWGGNILGVDSVHHSWEWDALPDMFFAGEPGDGSCYAEAESAVGDWAEFSEVEVPVVICGVKILFFDSF